MSALGKVISALLLLFVLAGNASDARNLKTFQKNIGGTKNDYGSSVVILPDKGYMLAGITNSYGAGGYDIVLVRTDSLGKTLWTKTYGGSGDEGTVAYYINYYVDAVLTPDSNIVVCSNTRSFGSGGTDVYLFKVDLNGNQKWAHAIGGSADEHGISLINDPNGGFLVAGSTASSGAGKGDVLLIKTNDTGGVVWSKTYGNASNEETAYKIKPSKDGNFLLCGYSLSTSSAYDYMMMKVTKSGTLVWAKVYGASSYETANDITETPDYSIYMVGFTYNTATSTNTACISKYDSSGNLKWAKIYGVHGTFRSIKYDAATGLFNTSTACYFTGPTQRIGLMRIDTSGNCKFINTYGPASSGTTQYTFGQGHDFELLPSGGFISLQSNGVSGSGGYDMELIRTDKNGNIDGGCNFMSSTLTPAAYVLTNHSYSFSVGAASLTTKSATGSAGQKFSESFVCQPFKAEFTYTVNCHGKVFFMEQCYTAAVGFNWAFGDSSASVSSSTEPNPVFVYKHSGTYTVKLLATNGAVTDTVIKTITIFIPDSGFTSVYAGGNVYKFKANDTTLISYAWSFGDSAHATTYNPTHTYAHSGYHHVTVKMTGENGCSYTGEQDVAIENAGIKANNNDAFKVDIYPNPFQGQAQISYTLKAADKINIVICDEAGKQIANLLDRHQNAGKYTTVIDAENLGIKSGLYFIKITDNQNTSVTRLIKL